MTELLSVSLEVDQLVETYRQHLSHGRAALGQMLGGVVEVASEGAWVHASNGRRYLDFGGYGVFILGHRHPKVVRAVHEQIDAHPLSTRVFLEPTAARAAEALTAVSPDGLEFVHFVNSGAEATEAALKLARYHGHNALVSTVRGFHGKTLGALSATANELYQRPFEPLLPGCSYVPYGDAEAMRRAVAERGRTACVIVEPVQGEGGVVVPPPGYLTAVSEACREHGAFLVVDEIQSGLGRMGTWWGHEGEQVTPDVMLVGKGLSGGVVPVAAMVCTGAAYAPFGDDPFLHSSTFGASPIACAAAYAAVTAIAEEGIVERARALGERLIPEISRLCAELAPGMVTEVRGRGLLIGLQCREPGVVGELVLEMLEGGVVVNHSLNAAAVLRFTPPAILDEDDIDIFTTTLSAALSAVAGRV